MQSNRKLICSPSADDKKKTPAPADGGQTLVSAWPSTGRAGPLQDGPRGHQDAEQGDLERTHETAHKGGVAENVP